MSDNVGVEIFGLRFYSYHNFHQLFEVILPKLAQLNAYCDDDGYSIGHLDDEEMEDSIREQVERGTIAGSSGSFLLKGQVLSIIAPYLNESWNSILCVPLNVTHDQVLKIDTALYRDSVIPSVPFTMFFNWDGAYWQLFTTDEDIYNLMSKVHAGDDQVTVCEDRISEYPNPTAKRDDFIAKNALR
ncbi:MAG: hypothetical protein HRU15_03660 [Planctomycetes bacterium]|nr:hypothetical protein [Planctomycetota bacterium]